MSTATAPSEEDRPAHKRLLDEEDSFSATDSPHTELEAVPEAAVIEYEEGADSRDSVGVSVQLDQDGGLSSEALLAVTGEGIRVRWLIARAMIDPDATVVPIE